MTNYDKITKAMHRQLAEILDGFNPDALIDWYCAGKCGLREDGECPIENEDEGGNAGCPISRAEMILRWLNEAVKE